MSKQDIMKLIEEACSTAAKYELENYYGTSKDYTAMCKVEAGEAQRALQSAVETLQAELAAINKEAETNQKWAFLEWRNKAEQLEIENLGLRLECQGLKAEIAEVKSYWKEAARKNAEMLAREANRLGDGL